MKVVFHTNHVDETFYRQMVHQYIAQTLVDNPLSWKFYKKHRNSWEIHIHPTEDWLGEDFRSENTGTINSKIPHGVTGEGIAKVYIQDTKDKGLFALQNLSAVYHEVAHVIMIILFRGKRGVFRNNDLGGNKKGREANVSTQEVHDRQMEGHMFLFKTYINIGNWIFRKWIPFTSVGIDLRDYIEGNV